MRTNILITKAGVLLNPRQNNLISESSVNGSAGSSLFNNQVTLTFYDNVNQLENGLYVPNKATVIKSGLTGTIKIEAFAADDTPYPVVITPTDTIDISESCILLWYGITEALDITCTNIVGAEYINILIDRT